MKLGQVLQVLAGAAIAVALLLPLFVLGQQANNLRIAKLEIELAQARTSLASAQAVAPSASTPAAAPPSSTTPALAAATGEMAAITRSVTELARRVEGLAARTAIVSTTPAASGAEQPVREAAPASSAAVRPAPPASPRASVAGTKVRVRFPSECLKVANDVGQQLIDLGANPVLIEGTQRGLGRAQALYTNAQQLDVATQLAEGLGTIIRIELVEDTSGQALDAVQLQLVSENNCGRNEL